MDRSYQTVDESTKKIWPDSCAVFAFLFWSLNSHESDSLFKTIEPSVKAALSFSGDRQMTSREYFEQTATAVATLDREELKKRIRNFKGRFRLDFTEDYLNKLTIDRLRHILLAALINAKSHN